MKQKIFLLLMLALLPLSALAAEVKVIFSGLEKGDKAILSIASGTYLASIPVSENGTFTFANVPDGKHSVKAEATGYNVMEAMTVIVKNNSVTPSQPLKIAITKMSKNPDSWTFEWKEDGSPSGHTTTAHRNEPAEIEFLGKMIVPADVPSFSILKEKYNIVLANDEKPWSQEYAYRMVETMKTLPLFYAKYKELKPAKFSLTADHLADDISVVPIEGGYEVRISEDAFYYANPFLVDLDGKRGRLFSKRLHHALTNYITDFGRNISNVNDILSERFGCSILNIDYTELTKPTTQEDAACFQQFKPAELVSIINMFEEFPDGFRKVPHLKYLLRRQNGHDHPLYPTAAAVAWPTLENGYIEFMEKAFGGNSQELATQRLILHEKTHFLWEHVFSEEIKADWIELGGWYVDPNAPEGWSTTKTTEFVSAYAHGKNPNEDMAESVADYVKNPAILMSRSVGKYEFIRDRIMHGVRYITTVPDHLSFEVLNLWPDYDFPGKIKRASITVDGKPEEDKLLTLEIELNDMPNIEDGASHAYTRITSPEFLDDGELKTQLYDIHMNPLGGNNHILRGSVIISKYSKAGHWIAGDITTNDLQGNERYEGHNDCVTDFFIDNPLEDLYPPKYESGSLNYELTDTILAEKPCKNLKITCKITDNVGISRVVARISSDAEGFSQSVDYDGVYDPTTDIVEFNFPIKEFLPTANYYVSSLSIYDSANTNTRIWFSESPNHEPVKKIFIQTSNPDTLHAEIDLNRIYVYAEPTHPEAPDGETKVTINFYARDNISGLGTCEYYFIDPQGVRHGNYYYEHRNSRTEFFDGDPTVWEHYQIVHILPRGSVPGRWGLASINVRDKAFNEYTYNFLETLIFEPDNDMSKYELFADMEDPKWLSIILSSESSQHFGFKYRVIHEKSGKEISGVWTGNQSAENVNVRQLAHAQTAKVDISSLPDGELIVIANVLDENGKIETAKSTKFKKTAGSGILESGSLAYALTDTVVGDKKCQHLKVSCGLKGNARIEKITAILQAAESPLILSESGTVNADATQADFHFLIKDYYPSADYYVSQLDIQDGTGTQTHIEFNDSTGSDSVKTQYIATSNPDTTAVEIDGRRLYIYAEPDTANEGSTKVTLNFYAKDDISGLGHCEYTFRTPTGEVTRSFSYTHRNSETPFFAGDATKWERYQLVHLLPQDSVQGRWELASLKLVDKAFNAHTYTFKDTLVFETVNTPNAYKLDADMVNAKWLSMQLSSGEDAGVTGYKYRIIHESDSLEVTGMADSLGSHLVDVSSLPEGQLLVIASVQGEDGTIRTAQSAKVLKSATGGIYQSGSLAYALTDTVVGDKKCQHLKVSCGLKGNARIEKITATLQAAESPLILSESGTVNADATQADFHFLIKDYYPSADYYVSQLDIQDGTGTHTHIEFNDSSVHNPYKKIFIKTPNPDDSCVEIDVNSIYVYAEASSEDEEGTKVMVNFSTRDDISGLGTCEYTFKTPNGLTTQAFTYEHRNSSTEFFDGDPTAWEYHQIVHFIPQDSTQGRWELVKIRVLDKAFNEYNYIFKDKLVFETANATSECEMNAEMIDGNWLSIALETSLSDMAGFKYRVIHEESGKEVAGSAENRQKTLVDLSKLPDGNLLVITQILDVDGHVLTSKFAKVTKDSNVTAVNHVASQSYTLIVNGLNIIINSHKDQNIIIANLNGQYRTYHLEEGINEIKMPQPGVYIIGGKKIVVQ